MPASAFVEVALVELPVLRRVVETGEQPLALLVVGDVQHALHDRGAGGDDPLLERLDLVVAGRQTFSGTSERTRTTSTSS